MDGSVDIYTRPAMSGEAKIPPPAQTGATWQKRCQVWIMFFILFRGFKPASKSVSWGVPIDLWSLEPPTNRLPWQQVSSIQLLTPSPSMLCIKDEHCRKICRFLLQKPSWGQRWSDGYVRSPAHWRNQFSKLMWDAHSYVINNIFYNLALCV